MNQEQPPVQRTRRRKKSHGPLIALSILAAGIMVSGTVLFTQLQDSPNQEATVSGSKLPEYTISVRPLGPDDHVRGNPNAPIVIVEYSDFECPACKFFHQVMTNVMKDYGKDGQVAWVYRHLPVEQLHQKAWHEAMATECVAELGGNDAFWTMADLIFENTSSNDGLDLNLLPEFAEQAGVSRADYEFCMADERMRPKVEEDYQEALERGGAQGTPHNIIIAGGEQLPISGAVEYTQMRQYIELIYQQVVRGQVPTN